jgi:hypothetical protein
MRLSLGVSLLLATAFIGQCCAGNLREAMLTKAEEQPLLQNMDLILDSAPLLTAFLEDKFHEEKFHALSTPTMEPTAEPAAQSTKLSGVAIACIVIGCVVGVTLLIALHYLDYLAGFSLNEAKGGKRVLPTPQ